MTTTLWFGDLRTGRFTDTLDATSCSWKLLGNDAGSVDQVTIEEHEVRAKALRRSARGARTFLAVDVDGRLQEAGPIWSRVWDETDTRQWLTLGSSGLWSLFDHRKVLPVLYDGIRVQTADTVVSGTDLGGIARALVAQAMSHVGGNLPLILPEMRVGDRTETFRGWALADVGDELRQLTKRESGAPDIRFRPRYNAARDGVEWVLEAGTEDAPLLTQAGDDWYFDRTARESNVLKITTDEDATQMGSRGWVTGNGQEEDILLGSWYDPSLINDGYPLLEVQESRSQTTEQDTLGYRAEALVDRSSRPVELWRLTVRNAAAVDALPGHYARVVVPADHAWLPGGESYMRIYSKSGGLGETMELEMYDVAGIA